MPLVCIAWAVDLISDSETLQPYAFQSLKPICGVGASPLPRAAAGCAVPRASRGAVMASSTAEKVSARALRRDGDGGSGGIVGMGHLLLDRMGGTDRRSAIAGGRDVGLHRVVGRVGGIARDDGSLVEGAGAQVGAAAGFAAVA